MAKQVVMRRLAKMAVSGESQEIKNEAEYIYKTMYPHLQGKALANQMKKDAKLSD